MREFRFFYLICSIPFFIQNSLFKIESFKFERVYDILKQNEANSICI